MSLGPRSSLVGYVYGAGPIVGHDCLSWVTLERWRHLTRQPPREAIELRKERSCGVACEPRSALVSIVAGNWCCVRRT